MKLHANAALSLIQRRRLAGRVVEDGWTLRWAAEAAGVSVRCARKWVGRYRADGELGLIDRSSAPRVVANRTDDKRVEAIVALRRVRFTAPEIAEILDMALSTVSGILTRFGIGKLGRLGLQAAERYERERPGELVHVDVKKLGRIIVPGHRITGNRRQAARRRPIRLTAAASATRAGSSSTSPSTITPALPTPRSSATRRRPRRSRSFAAPSRSPRTTGSPSSGCSPTTVRRTAPRSMRSRAARSASATDAPAPAARRPTARPSASIRTMLDGWAYGALYRNSQERTAALDGWLWHYNHRLRHPALGHHPHHKGHQPPRDLQLAAHSPARRLAARWTPAR